MRFYALVLTAMLLVGCAPAVPPSPPPTSLTITTNLPPATIGEIYIQQLTATGGTAPYTWSIVAGTPPKGVTLSTTGVLSGIPANSGSFNFTVQVVDSASAVAQIHIERTSHEAS